MDNWVLWVLVATVAVAAIYFIFVRKLLNKPAQQTAVQPKPEQPPAVN